MLLYYEPEGLLRSIFFLKSMKLKQISFGSYFTYYSEVKHFMRGASIHPNPAASLVRTSPTCGFRRLSSTSLDWLTRLILL